MKQQQQQKENRFDTILRSRRFDPSAEVPEEKRVMMINGRIIANNQNIVTMQAKQKSGKTVFMTAIMAAALSKLEVFRIMVLLPEDKKRVVFMDTEQGQSDFYKVLKRMKSLAGLYNYPSWFDAYNFREDDPDTIVACIDRYIQCYPDTGLALVDNTTDLLNSFNDEVESKSKIQLFKKWSKQNDTVFVQALHTGRGGENSLGHYGAYSDRASQSVLHIEKTERGTIVMRPHYMRSDEDFDPIELMYNREAHNWEETIHISDADKAQIRGKHVPMEGYDDTEHHARLSYIFNTFPFCPYDKVVQGIMEIYACPRQFAKESLRFFLQKGFIYKTIDGYTRNQQAKLYIDEK